MSDDGKAAVSLTDSDASSMHSNCTWPPRSVIRHVKSSSLPVSIQKIKEWKLWANKVQKLSHIVLQKGPRPSSKNCLPGE